MQPRFYWQKFTQKWNSKPKIQNWSVFQNFQSPEPYILFLVCSQRYRMIKYLYFIFGLNCIAKCIGWIKIYISYLVYSQIWLIFSKDGCHCGFKREFRKKNTLIWSLQKDKPHPICEGDSSITVLSLNCVQSGGWSKKSLGQSPLIGALVSSVMDTCTANCSKGG
jgi:hypothetical protein